MVLVHIGLGKTGTTTLQRYVYPKFAKIRKNVDYNDREILRLSFKEHMIGLSVEELASFRSRLRNNNDVFVSMESLVNWNPRLWELAANKNLQLFGKEAIIVITVRETVSYLTSLYQQMIHQGWVVDPHDFFVSSGMYSSLDKTRSIRSGDCFDVESFDLERLYNIYDERFDKVLMIPMSEICNFRFLDFFSLEKNEKDEILKIYDSAPRVNKSYSSVAMKLTFKRERLLKKIGLQSYCSQSDIVWGRGLQKTSKKRVKYSELKILDKIIFLPVRVARKAVHFLGWRHLMQNLVNNYFPYNKYKLPEDVVSKMKGVKEKNDAFVNKLSDGFLE